MKVYYLIIALLFASTTFAQTVDETYRKPLKDVLKEVESRFQVKLTYDEKLVADRSVSYAQWRFKDDVEATMQSVLGSFDLVFSKSGEGNYKIETFQYHRRPVEDGRKHLERLLSLYPTLPDWKKRKAGLQQCFRSTLGLTLLPAGTKTNPVYAGKRTLNGYTAENVAIESLPGVFVSGTLYRPLKGKGPFPAVMVAQGHGEIQHYGESSQQLSATLARMGAVVFSYDMFAKGEESLQFAFEDHRTVLAPILQTLNSIRILDFLSALPFVDSKRIAMTGASGGGTQTFLMTALDPRIAVSVPVVMVSSWFFGGCPCESGMPIHSCGEWGTNNVEIAAMAAPRPMLVVSDGGDWTAHVPELEFPYLKKVYSLFGKPELVENVHLEKEGHDYGPSKRQATYRFLAKELGLNIETVKTKSGEVDESKGTIESKSTMLVFGENGERLPAHAIHGIEALKELLNKRNFQITQQKPIPRDTSYTPYQTWIKIRKEFPEARIVKSQLPEGVMGQNDLVYTTLPDTPYGKRDLHLDLFRPEKSGKYPALLLIHGGGWRSGDKSMQVPLAQQIAARGYVTATVEYRLSPEALYPAAVYDIKAAIRFLRANAAKYSIDPDKIAITGSSAGGQLAALIGATSGVAKFEGNEGNPGVSSAVQAIIDMDGVLDFNTPDEKGKDEESAKRSAGALWFGATFNQNSGKWIEASPIHYVGKNTPPVLFINSALPRFHYGRDSVIVLLNTFGVYTEVHTIPETPHPFWLFHPWFEPTVKYMVAFLDKILKN